jgi:MFS transporter, DHA2 family, methylenomycin A resistance protein
MSTPPDTQSSSRWLAVGVMCVAYFLVLLDVTIVNVALPQIGDRLGAGVSDLQWVVDGYALAFAALLLAGGTIGDLRGHKRVVLSGLVVFAIASAGCGLAPDITALIIARVAQGVGAALALPGTLAIITRAFPKPAEQARAIGIWAGVGSVALPAGPLLGGALVSGVGWRAVFFLNVPIVAGAGLLAVRVVHESRAEEPRRLDWAGVLLGALALGATTFAVIEAGHSGLGAVVVIAGLLGVAALMALLGVERRATDPMLPLGLFSRPAFSSANGVAAAMNLGSLGLLFLLTQYLQTVEHHTALVAGVSLLPLFSPLAILAPLAGRLTARVGPKPPMVAGLLLGAVGVALLARLHTDSAYLDLLPATLAWGIGLGLLTPAVVAAAVAAVESDRAGLASGVNNTARQAGGAIGIAAFGAIAGPASHPARFLTGLHVTGLITAGLFVGAALVTVLLIPSGPSADARRPEGRRQRQAGHVSTGDP